MSEYQLLNHIGTHVDAPSHLSADGDTLDEIDLTRLVCDAVDDRRLRRASPARCRWPSSSRTWSGCVPATSSFLNSGNGPRYGTEAYWTGWSYPDAEASRALVERGDLRASGSTGRPPTRSTRRTTRCTGSGSRPGG